MNEAMGVLFEIVEREVQNQIVSCRDKKTSELSDEDVRNFLLGVTDLTRKLKKGSSVKLIRCDAPFTLICKSYKVVLRAEYARPMKDIADLHPQEMTYYGEDFRRIKGFVKGVLEDLSVGIKPAIKCVSD